MILDKMRFNFPSAEAKWKCSSPVSFAIKLLSGSSTVVGWHTWNPLLKSSAYNGVLVANLVIIVTILRFSPTLALDP